MNADPSVLVTGGTGTTGRRVAALLRRRGVGVRTASRRPGSPGHVRFDWADRQTHRAALAGIERVYLVPPVGVLDPRPMVEPFVADAVAAGVWHIVLLGSAAIPAGADGLNELRFVVRQAPMWTVLRPSWFMQNVIGAHPLAVGIRERGEIVTATGRGRVAFIDAADIAEVAATLLAAPRVAGAEHVLTGPSAISYPELAGRIGEVSGRPVRHVDVSPHVLAANLAESGLPPGFATALAALDTAIRAGSEDRVTTDVADLTGRAPRSFDDFAIEHRGEWTPTRAAGVTRDRN